MDLPDPGIKPGSPALQEDSLPTELWGKNYGILLNGFAIMMHVGRLSNFLLLQTMLCDLRNMSYCMCIIIYVG